MDTLELLKDMLGKRGFNSWLKKSKEDPRSTEEQARSALANLEQAAKYKEAWQNLCKDLDKLIKSPDTFFGDTEEEIEKERTKASKQLNELKTITNHFPLFSPRPIRLTILE
jgi:biopolymer transport protein ExbB/TolQ